MAKKIAIGLLLLIFTITLLSGCKSSKVPNRIYKKLATDAVPLDNDYKKNIMAQKCNSLFPVVPITVIKDSIRTKIVKVQDNTLVNKLKAKLAKGCPTLNIDSIYNELPLDTVFIDHYKTKTVTVKDTTGNYFRQLNEDALRDTTNKYKAENTSLKTQLEDTNKKLVIANSTSDKWKVRFILAMIALVVSYGVYGYFKLRKSLMPKI